MITRENYKERIKGVDFSKLSKDLQDSKTYFDEVTVNGEDYSIVDQEPEIQEMVDLYFQLLTIEISAKLSSKTNDVKQIEKAVEDYKKYIKNNGVKREGLPKYLWDSFEWMDQIISNKALYDNFLNSKDIQSRVESYLNDFNNEKNNIVKLEEETIEDVLLKSPNVRQKMPRHQQRVLKDAHIDVVKRLEKELSEIPPLRSQDFPDKNEVIVHAHYFHGGTDWFITEQDAKNDEYYSYVILNGDSQMSEFGYSDISFFSKQGSIELDFHWKKKSLAEALYDADPTYFDEPKPRGKRRAKKSATNDKLDYIVLKMELDNHGKLVRDIGITIKDVPEELLTGWNLVQKLKKAKVLKTSSATLTKDEINDLEQFFRKFNDFAYQFRDNNLKSKNTKSKKFDVKKAKAFFDKFLIDLASPIVELWVNPSIEEAKVLRNIKKQMGEFDNSEPYSNLRSFRAFNKKAATLYNGLVDHIEQHEDNHRKSNWSDYMSVYKYFLENVDVFLKSYSVKSSSKTIKQPNYNSAKKKSIDVEKVSDELKFIKRYVRLHDKKKTRNQIRLFISALQKAIRERRITKDSEYAKEIMHIQDRLLYLYKQFENDIQLILVDIDDELRNQYFELIGLESEMLSVKLIKSFINIQGRVITNSKAQNLLNRINRAIRTKKITKKDKYWEQVNDIKNDLEIFVEKNKGEGIIRIEPQALNGLSGILNNCGCSTNTISANAPLPLNIKHLTKQYRANQNELNGAENFFMSSMDLDEVEFEHVGLFGRWLHLIGDPAKGARIAVYGNPKIGKSYLMIEFAGDLAKSGRKVLYVAKEEGKSATLKKKLRETNAKSPNLFVTDYIPENLSTFDFVFFDSISKCKLTPEDLLAIKWASPNTVKVEIHQVNKEGKARGLNDFIHDVDSIIRLPERGVAIQEGRFEEYSELHFDVAA